MRDTGRSPVRRTGTKDPVAVRERSMAASRPSRRDGIVSPWRDMPEGETMRVLRAAVVAVVGAGAVLFAPGVATAAVGSGHCDPPWFWWIPLPCLTE